MNEPLKPVWSIVERMRVFEETSGWADELEANLRAWDADLRMIKKAAPGNETIDWVRERLLDVPPK